MTDRLTVDNPISEVFEFSGTQHILIVGEGTATIERSLNKKDFYPMTTERGELMSFVGDKVLFNSEISSSQRLFHRVVAETTTHIDVTVVKGRN